MKTATASCRSYTAPSRPERTRARGLLGLSLSASLLAGLCVSAGACKKASTGTPTTPPATVIDNCAPNVGNTSGNAVTITSGTAYEGKICFEGGSSWYKLAVPAGSTLLDVSAGYGSQHVTPVTLDVKVYFKSDATTLTELQELKTPLASDAGIQSIHTTVQVEAAGDYYIQAADAVGKSFDAKNAYTIKLTTAADPDSHEPNDSPAAAKPTDSNPGFLAYLGDLDVFTTNVTSASDLLTLTIKNPPTAPGTIAYTITTGDAGVVASGTAPPLATAFNSTLPVTAAGAYYLTLSYPSGTTPDRAAADGYTVTFGTTTNPDTTNNHTIATAVCPGGGAGPCTNSYSGTAVTLPPVSSYISVQGQHDYYRVDLAQGSPAVLEINLASSPSSSVKYAVDLLATDPTSVCHSDSDCTGLDAPCTNASDCELSHACLPAGKYGFCPSSGVACTLCEGSGVCIPAGSGSGYCAISQYLSAYTPGGTDAGTSFVSTAQPLFRNGAFYVNVHDAKYTNVDEKNPYTLTMKMVPEPDPNDQSATPASRNNFYNPYPNSKMDLAPSAARAIDITAQVDAGTEITGYISYQTDEDWYSFQHPCPGQNCGIDFEWVQPGPSNAQVAFVMLNHDLTVHESFGYVGTTATTALSGPTNGKFANADCTQCSFASSLQSSSSGPYLYYLRIADLGQKGWDNTSSGKYSFKVSGITPGCPAACAQAPSGICGCYCSSTQTCPSPTQ